MGEVIARALVDTLQLLSKRGARGYSANKARSANIVLGSIEVCPLLTGYEPEAQLNGS